MTQIEANVVQDNALNDRRKQKGFFLRWPGLGLCAGGVGLAASFLVAVLISNQPVEYRAEGKLVLNAIGDMPSPAAAKADVTSSHSRSGSLAAVSTQLTGKGIAEATLLSLKSSDLSKSIENELSEPTLREKLSGWLLMVGSTDQNQSTQRFLQRLSVDQIENSRIFSVSYKSGDPYVAAATVNQVMDSYLDIRQETRLDQRKLATQKLLREIAVLQDRNKTLKNELIILSDTKTGDTKAKSEELAASKELLDNLLLRYKEAQIMQKPDMQAPMGRILARATNPYQPIENPTWQSAVLAFLLAGGAALLLLRRVASRFPEETMVSEPSVAEEALPQDLASDASITLDDVVNEDDHEPEEIQETSRERHGYNEVGGAMDLAWEVAHHDKRRIVHLSAEEDAVQNTHIALHEVADTLAEWGRSVLVIEAERFESHADLAKRDIGLSDVIDGQAAYIDVINPDLYPRHHCVTSGTRDLMNRDFPSRSLHTFLLAAESIYDFVLIDLGQHYQDERALESLALTAETHLTITAPASVMDYEAELTRYFEEKGFSAVTIQHADGGRNGLAVMPSSMQAA